MLLNKTDLVSPDTMRRIVNANGTTKAWAISLANGEGIQMFMNELADALKSR